MTNDFKRYTDILSDGKIVLYGADEYGAFVQTKLKSIGMKTWYFCDMDSAKDGSCYTDDILVISSDKLRELDEKERISIIITSRASHIIMQTMSVIANLKLKTDRIFTIYKFEDFISIIPLNNGLKPILENLEINITDECNLKCKGCTHFSNLFSEESHYNLGEFKRDLTEISNNCYVFRLHLLGGEPLLCDNLYEYVDFVRSVFPRAYISVVTNGLLFFNHSDKLYRSMRKNNVSFWISPYKPTLKIKDEIIRFLSLKEVDFNFETSFRNDEIISKFMKTLSSNLNSNPNKSLLVCGSRNCNFLRNGKLYKCPIEGMIYKYFSTFGINDDLKCGTDIYNITDWYKTVYELNVNPVETCRCCSEKPEFIDWEISVTPDRNDWIAVD
jgi:organic radical activating enzyme